MEFTEIFKLKDLLDQQKISYKYINEYKNNHIIIVDDLEIIQDEYSLGGKEDLLQIILNDKKTGFLTAEQALDEIKTHIEHVEEALGAEYLNVFLYKDNIDNSIVTNDIDVRINNINNRIDNEVTNLNSKITDEILLINNKLNNKIKVTTAVLSILFIVSLFF